MATQPPKPTTTTTQVHLPRVTIKYCTQCKWMLRAAYVRPLHTTPIHIYIYVCMYNTDDYQFAQELLSTFNTDLAEVALIPVSGGVFTVTMYSSSPSSASASEGEISPAETTETVLWDRKVDGGFPGMFSFPLFYWIPFGVSG